MLVLSRKPGEKILVGEQIVVNVVSVSASRVRLAIEAPRDMPIVRKELQTSPVTTAEPTPATA